MFASGQFKAKERFRLSSQPGMDFPGLGVAKDPDPNFSEMSEGSLTILHPGSQSGNTKCKSSTLCLCWMERFRQRINRSGRSERAFC